MAKIIDLPDTDQIKRKLLAETHEAKGFAKEFREFVMRGNVLDLAVGIVIGAAFTNIVNSLVNDVIMPPIGFLTQKVDFSSLYFSLDGVNYPNLTEAVAASAPVIKYGSFINAIINFLIVAFVIFMVVRQVNALKRREDAKQRQDTPEKHFCEFCYQEVHEKATRCPFCTSEIKPV